MDLDREIRCGRSFLAATSEVLSLGVAGYGESLLESGWAGPDVKSALLGQEPRYAPDRSFDTLHIRLELDVDMDRRQVSGICKTRIRALAEHLNLLTFDAVDMRVLRAVWEGKKIRLRYDGHVLKIHLPRRLRSGEEAELEVHYRLLHPRAGLHFIPMAERAVGAVRGGSHRGKAGAQPAEQAWSQGQPEDSRFWFPCHDAPHEKATSEILATVDSGFVAVSNGVLLETRTEGPRGKVTYHWRMDQPHSVYLITLAVGRFGIVEDRWDHVPLILYCEKGREPEARRGLGKTAKAMEFFSSSIGVPYPYPKYAQVCVRQFPGGMENTTATTMTDACLIDPRASLDTDVDLLMAHELAHQWFGDLVTCRDWSHAWLNEGFATYFETLFTLHDKGQDEFDYEQYRNQKAYFQEDQDRYRRPIVCRTFKRPWVLFDRHLYEKGSCVLHMLRYTLTDELWWRSIRHYVEQHRDQSVETENLILAIEAATGRNLRPFFDRWVFRSGYPHFKVRYLWKPQAKTVQMHLIQTQPVSEEAAVFKLDLEWRFAGRGWVREFRKSVEQKEHHWSFRLPGFPLAIELDPHHWILKKVDFRKPLSMWLHQLQHAPRAMSRILAAHEVAKWGGEAAVEALTGAVNREKFWGAAAEAALALGSIKTPSALSVLRDLVRHPHPKVRHAVVQALSDFKTEEAARVLGPIARHDPSIHVEAEAVRALGGMRDPRFLPLLRRKLFERSYWDTICSGAVQGLTHFRDPKILPLLHRLSLPKTSYPARAHAVRALASYHCVSSQVLGWLCGHAKDPDERIALVAVQALGRMEDPAALPTLEAIRDKSPNSRLQTYAEEAISRLTAGSNSKGGGRAA